MSNVLVLNMGLKSIRSIIFDEEGNKLTSSSRAIETGLMGDHVTQNPSEWWSKAVEVIKECVHVLQGVDVDYITVTASSACLVYIDEKGNELDKSIMVSDKRAIEETRKLQQCKSFQEVQVKTGLGADPYLLIPKIIWVKDNQPDLYNKTYKFLSPNDYLIGKLTGKYVTDYFNAQKYHYDCKENRYPEELLFELGIELDLLPEVVSPGSIVGTIKEDIADLLNLNKNVKIVATSYDAICSFFGSGPSEEGEASDVSGTVTTFRVLSRKQDLYKSAKVFNQPFIDWGINIVGGSNNLGGGLIEWVKQCYYINEQYPYEVMEKEARESSLGADGLIFLPYLLGERAPVWDSCARGVFFGLERTHTRKDMTRAVFESAGFVIKDMIEAIEETGVEVSNIRFSGGLARINLISQLKADITGKDILVLDDFETTAIGAAILTLVSVGVYKDAKEASKKFVAVRMIIKPNFKNNEKYNKIYKMYKDTYGTLKELFVERKQLVDTLYREKESVIENL
jgi:xylulokinase